MIEIRNITQTPCKLYDPDDNLIGLIDSDLVLNDVRIQIKQQNLDNYYIMFNGTRIDINKKGRLQWPDGFFDLLEHQLSQL